MLSRYGYKSKRKYRRTCSWIQKKKNADEMRKLLKGDKVMVDGNKATYGILANDCFKMLMTLDNGGGEVEYERIDIAPKVGSTSSKKTGTKDKKNVQKKDDSQIPKRKKEKDHVKQVKKHKLVKKNPPEIIVISDAASSQHGLMGAAGSATISTTGSATSSATGSATISATGSAIGSATEHVECSY